MSDACGACRLYLLRTGAAIVLLVASGAGVGSAQQPRDMSRVDCRRSVPADSTRGVGIIRGVVRNDSTGRPVGRGAVVILLGIECRALTDTGGAFELTGVPFGDHRLEVAPTRFRRFTPISVSVTRSASAYAELRVVTENRVTDCMEMPACAELLARAPSDTTLTDAERLLETAHRTGVAIAVVEGWELGEFAVCLAEPNPRVVRALSAGIPGIVARDECALTRGDRPQNRDYLARTSTGQKAVAFTAAIVAQSVDRATARLTSYVGPRYGSGWTCEFQRRNSVWAAVSCRRDWIS